MVQTSNCGPSRPLMELGTGQAPRLDYSLPQQSCITALTRILLTIPREWFRDDSAAEPDNHWWKMPRGNLDEIRDLLVSDVSSSHAGAIIDRRVADVVRSAEQRITETHTKSSQTTRTASPSSPASSHPSPNPTAQRPVSAAVLAAKAPVATANASRSLNSRSWSVNIEETARKISEGLRPVAVGTLGGAATLAFVPKPIIPKPRLYLIEEYRVCSYLADYGAGKTISTISLLPGEKRKITLRTYQDNETTRTASENILDSFSQESADELEELIEIESGVSTGFTSSQTSGGSGSSGITVGLDLFSLVEFGVGNESEGSGSEEVSTTSESHLDTLERALTKHVEKSSYTREVEVNTTTSESVREGEEQSLAREFANINMSRVLNFVVRQLLQEYVTITYLHSVRVVYTNGYPETITPIELYELNELLPRFIKPEYLDDTKARILKPYCAVVNYRREPKRFIERVDHTLKDCEFSKGDERKVFYRKDLSLRDETDGLVVPGVIKRVQHFVLRTPAVIIDALMGQGESLDCYNQKLQAAAAERALLANDVTRAALEIVDSFATPKDRARAYVALLRECECQSEEPSAEESGKDTGQDEEQAP